MARNANVLIVDDDPALRQTMEAIVKSAGMNSFTAGTGEAALDALKRSPVDVILLDVQLPGISGLHVLRQVRERHPDIGVIMVSVVKEIPVAVEAIKHGALDYVTKDFAPGELSARVSESLEQLRAERELAGLRDEVASRGQKPMVIGRSPAMAQVVAVADKVAAKPVTVLITGESGTGKEVLARYLHDHSERRSGPFVAVNLPAIPGELVESLLFGHEKGSFTGAVKQSFGKFELANGGTLFLDEIGELKSDIQAKLLPALRDRREDIRDLALHFLHRYAAAYGRPPQTLTEPAIHMLEHHGWPGNIRELENLIERLVVVCDDAVVDESMLPLDLTVGAGLTREAEKESNFAAAMSAFEKGYLRRVLAQCGWNRRRAAEQLGLGYSSLQAKLRLHGLTPQGEGDD